VFVAVVAPWRRHVIRPAIAHPAVTVAALESEITADAWASDIADQPTPDKADGSGNDGSGDGSHSSVFHSVVRAGAGGREDDCDAREGKSTKRSHFSPFSPPDSELSRKLRRICDTNTQAEQIVAPTRPARLPAPAYG
jgi:hypothetical protein